MTSSTIGIFSSWNFFLMFSLTASGFGADKFDIQHCVYFSLLDYIRVILPCRSALHPALAQPACSFDRLDSLLMFSSKPSSLLPSKRSSLYFVSNALEQVIQLRSMSFRQGRPALPLLQHLTLARGTLLGRADYIGCRLLGVQRLADLLERSVLHIKLLLQIFRPSGLRPCATVCCSFSCELRFSTCLSARDCAT